jgi:hypothetical protein
MNNWLLKGTLKNRSERLCRSRIKSRVLNMFANQKKSEKLFPRAYFSESTTRDIRPKNSHLLIWIILGLVTFILGMFSFFQTDLIKEAAKLSEVIR